MRKLLTLSAALTVTLASAQTTNVAFVYWNTANAAFQEMAMGVKQAIKESKGTKLTSTAPNGTNPSQVVSMFQSSAQTSKDGIVLQALTPDLFFRPLKTATDAGIPVISIDAPPPKNAGVDLFVSNDNVELGRQLAREILKKIPANAKGKIVIGNSNPGTPPIEARVQGMIEVIKATRPNLTIVGPLETKGPTGSPSDVFTVWNGIVRANPDALAFLAPTNADPGALALIERQTGKKLLVGGCDLEPTALEGVKNGYIDVLISPEHWLKGYIAMKQLLAHAQSGTKIPTGFWNTGSLVVTQANVDKIIARQKTEASRALVLVPIAKKQLANPDAYLK
ncbi:sugar ABC transporter substrate-binding protein [Deinococcus alpinitundrae]|uniref:sugar ABC transporter substrate-binding protein n=1 Tax=Deinococcus alpinitundrae TaxID=468913 RepID=UPI00137B25AD|nr:sugar ABC transporter substrate-binding protein [Deinococcus alpinitundrae]